ncbi:MAG: hypothetical protein R3F56_21570 [Planctomycetota bacterium]
MISQVVVSVVCTVLNPQGCDGRGSTPVPAGWEAGSALQCAFAPNAPGFLLFTPAHREVVPRPGYRLGEAQVRMQWIVRFRCTGLSFLPVVPYEVRAYGYVLDVAEQACSG